MSNSPLYWFTVVLFGLICIGYYWYTRHATADQLLKGKIEAQEAEVATLKLLLDAAGISPYGVRIVQIDPEEPCWREAWHPVDRFLRVYRRFGQFGENCIGLDGDEIVSLSLVSHRLENTTLLAQLPALRTIQLREGRIASLDPGPSPCLWKELNLQSNKLTAVENLGQCTVLEDLDLSFNEISILQDLMPLSRLERLRLDNNRLEQITGLKGHSSITQLFSSNNKLTSIDGLSDMPWLGTLDVSSNAITSLAGLTDMPALRSLTAHSNPITEIEVATFDQLPLLQFVGLSRTAIKEKPERYVYRGAGEWNVEIVVKDGEVPKVAITDTPLARMLKEQRVETSDGKSVVPVAELPEGRGRVYKTTKKGRSGGILSQTVDYEGTMAGLDGTHSIGFSGLNQSVGVTVKASVEKGKLRVYLRDSQDGYYYKEAIPNRPLEMSGMLITGTTTYLIFFESVGGKAEGITWSAK